jgi:hypothetical protein
MNSKSHFWISSLKSLIRILVCILALKTNDIKVLAIGFLLAEVLGVLEELFDNR